MRAPPPGPSNRFVLLALSALSIACSRPAAEAPPATAARPVRTAAVAESAVTRPVTGTGTLAARDELELGFKVGGVVARVLVDAGDRVRGGQVLATLERREIDAGVAKAESGAEKARRDAERFGRLYADSVVTLAQFQDAATALEVARADLAAATFNQRYATIVAPAGGTVLRRRANPGELVTAGTPVLAVASDGRGHVLRVGLADRDVVRLTLGDAATVRFDAMPGRVLPGRVTQIGASAMPGTGTYAVEIGLAPSRELRTGLVGGVEIRPRGAESVRLVPLEAVVEADGDRAILFALDPGGTRAERREVTVAFTDGGRVAVTAGLGGVQRVVTEGAAYLDDGQIVRVLP